MFEVRHARTNNLVSRHKTEWAAWAAWAALKRVENNVAARLNKPGMQGGISAHEFACLTVVETEN